VNGGGSAANVDAPVRVALALDATDPCSEKGSSFDVVRPLSDPRRCPHAPNRIGRSSGLHAKSAPNLEGFEVFDRVLSKRIHPDLGNHRRTGSELGRHDALVGPLATKPSLGAKNHKNHKEKSGVLVCEQAQRLGLRTEHFFSRQSWSR